MTSFIQETPMTINYERIWFAKLRKFETSMSWVTTLSSGLCLYMISKTGQRLMTGRKTEFLRISKLYAIFTSVLLVLNLIKQHQDFHLFHLINWANLIFLHRSLEEIFSFGEGEAGDKKTMQYSKFFDILSWLAIAIKYYEHERVSPGVIHILRFFRMEKLNVKIKADLSEFLNDSQTK